VTNFELIVAIASPPPKGRGLTNPVLLCIASRARGARQFARQVRGIYSWEAGVATDFKSTEPAVMQTLL
jgi:hypothetical protein